MKSSLEAQQWRAVCQAHGVMWMAQFGSTVMGRQTQWSDLDLAVWLREMEDHGATQATALTNALMPLLERSDVDVAVLNHASPLLQWEVARTGRVLYETQHGAFRQFQLQAFKRHEDAWRLNEWNRRYVHDRLEEWARG